MRLTSVLALATALALAATTAPAEVARFVNHVGRITAAGIRASIILRTCSRCSAGTFASISSIEGIESWTCLI